MSAADQIKPESPESTQLAKRGRAPGGPPGNTKNLKHGVYSLTAARKRGKIDKRTSFGQAFERRKREYIAHLGGLDVVSTMELTIIEDTVWNDFYITAYDVYVSGLKSVIRKGRPHPIIDARNRASAHRRENLKILGWKRVSKTVSLTDILSQHEAGDVPGVEPDSGTGSNEREGKETE